MVAPVQTSTAGEGRPGTAGTCSTAERRPGTAGSISQSVRSMYSCKSRWERERFWGFGILGFWDFGVKSLQKLWWTRKDFDADPETLGRLDNGTARHSCGTILKEFRSFRNCSMLDLVCNGLDGNVLQLFRT